MLEVKRSPPLRPSGLHPATPTMTRRALLLQPILLRTITLLVIALGLAFSAVLAWQAEHSASETDRQRFQRVTELMHSEVTNMISKSEYCLQSTMALWSASKSVDRGEFTRVFDALDIPNKFPGALGIGFTRRVDRADLPAFLAATRADGAPDFKVKTSGDAPDLFIVEFNEPLARNQEPQGYDVGQEHTRSPGQFPVRSKACVRVVKINPDRPPHRSQTTRRSSLPTPSLTPTLSLDPLPAPSIHRSSIYTVHD
jgi:hypothetical protein